MNTGSAYVTSPVLSISATLTSCAINQKLRDVSLLSHRSMGHLAGATGHHNLSRSRRYAKLVKVQASYKKTCTALKGLTSEQSTQCQLAHSRAFPKATN